MGLIKAESDLSFDLDRYAAGLGYNNSSIFNILNYFVLPQNVISRNSSL